MADRQRATIKVKQLHGRLPARRVIKELLSIASAKSYKKAWPIASAKR